MIFKKVEVLSSICKTRVALGMGDICLSTGYIGDEDEKTTYIAFTEMANPHPIGPITDKALAPPGDAWEVMLSFTSADSIDNVITILEEAKANLLKGEDNERS